MLVRIAKLFEWAKHLYELIYLQYVFILMQMCLGCNNYNIILQTIFWCILVFLVHDDAGSWQDVTKSP